MGDLNVAHKEIDLKNPKTNRKKVQDSQMNERGKFTDLLNAGFIDTFRYFYPEKGRNILMVVLQIQRKKEECRVAY